ncbi:unnamed protein product [Sphenostylis stenocarpa]|uniref:Uncharacterized protein n=1 Tax=Sphenostylis stenocarpa TaxID=92480 RepID=A0AA86VB53_9FABA|nr:unnamed protein product [Sphenostylis stenocarpa]
MQTKLAESSQVIGPTDTVDNDEQPNNAVAFDDQAQAEDNDDGDVDMNDAEKDIAINLITELTSYNPLLLSVY